MASCEVRMCLVGFLLLSVVSFAASSLTCRIQIDFQRAIWDEGYHSETSNGTQCTDYLYETVQGGSIRTCTQFFNYNIREYISYPCILPCNSSCPQQGCNLQASRYKAKMCVPIQCLESCAEFICNEEGECLSNCDRECVYGRCDANGRCICNRGFAKDKRTDRCVPSDCNETCENGTCDKYGECICNYGFRKRYGNTCDRIICPDFQNKEFCQKECENSGCNGIKGQCKNGICRCKIGFRKSSISEYQCEKIDCSSALEEEDKVFCVSQCLLQCTNGSCNDGICQCATGFTKTPGSLYECTQIKCPATLKKDLTFCKYLCSVTCTNGRCNEYGACECQEGFVSTHESLKLDCHHECNVDRSCVKKGLVGAVGGGLAVIVVVIIVVGVVIGVVWTRNKKTSATKEREGLRLEPRNVPTKSKMKESSPARETYLEPRRVVRAPSDEYPFYDTISEVIPKQVNRAHLQESREHSYLQVIDSPAVTVGPQYMNVSQNQERNVYENSTGRK